MKKMGTSANSCFDKTKRKDKSRALTTSARLLTYNDSQLLLHVFDYREKMVDVHKELLEAIKIRERAA